jgi:hypothetical protein
MIASPSEHLPSSFAELVFNLDEACISEWEDRAPRKVIVSVSMTDNIIHYGVHRNLKHMPVICCVLAGGGSLTLFVVSLQVNDKVIETLKIRISDKREHGTGTQAKGICHCNTFSAVWNKCPDPVH